jgi:nucleotide-binding universal stress UspA family protein
MKHIVVPTDFSEASLHAIDFVLKLYAKDALTLHLLNVYTPMPITGRFMTSTDTADLLSPILEEASSSNLSDLKFKLLREFSGSQISIRLHSSFGLLNHALSDIIDSADIDLVVSASSKTTDLHSFLLGNNTVSMIKSLTQTPLLVVPKVQLNPAIHSIAVAVDLTRPISEYALKTIDALAKEFNARISYIHIEEESYLATSHAYERFSTSGKALYDAHQKEVTLILGVGSISSALSEFCDLNGHDLLVLLYHRNNFLYRLTHEPVIRKMLYRHVKPVYIIPEELD